MDLTDRDLGLWNYYTSITQKDSCGYIILLANYFLPEQLNPSPSVNGCLHVQLKFADRGPSLVQSAFSSHGFDRQGSGTVQNGGK